MVTPGGFTMSVAMTNCGDAGWVTDRSGYRYDPIDPETGRRWPPMPAVFSELAEPSRRDRRVCRLRAGRLPHQPLRARRPASAASGSRTSATSAADRLGFARSARHLPLGRRSRGPSRPRRVPLVHGDVVVWGGAARLTFHGVHPLAEGHHPLTGNVRYNLTLRQAA